MVFSGTNPETLMQPPQPSKCLVQKNPLSFPPPKLWSALESACPSCRTCFFQRSLKFSTPKKKATTVVVYINGKKHVDHDITKKTCKACKLVLFETYFVSDVGDLLSFRVISNVGKSGEPVFFVGGIQALKCPSSFGWKRIHFGLDFWYAMRATPLNWAIPKGFAVWKPFLAWKY